jgi:hypothetical protein
MLIQNIHILEHQNFKIMTDDTVLVSSKLHSGAHWFKLPYELGLNTNHIHFASFTLYYSGHCLIGLWIMLSMLWVQAVLASNISKSWPHCMEKGFWIRLSFGYCNLKQFAQRNPIKGCLLYLLNLLTFLGHYLTCCNALKFCGQCTKLAKTLSNFVSKVINWLDLLQKLTKNKNWDGLLNIC